MSRSPRSPLRRLRSVLASLLLLSSVFVVTGALQADAAACSKTYTATTVSQDKITPGGSGNFTVQFKNTATNCTSVAIGSIKIFVPSGWTANSVTPGTGWNIVSGSPAGQVWLSATSGTAKIANSATLDVVVNTTAPASAACGPVDWNTRAWVATDFTSSEFTPATAKVNVSCAALAFVNQPAVTEKDKAITDADNSNGDPIAVSASADGSPVASVTVTLTIGTNPSNGALSPSPAQATTDSNGVATFAGISINKSGEGYTLVASATGLSSATSDPFDIVDKYVECGGAPCEGSATGGGTGGDIQANTSPTFLTVSILSPGLIDCAGYQEITGTVSWKTDDQGNQIGTITAEDSLVKKLRPPDRGAAHFQVCFSPDAGKSFIDRGGNTVVAGQAGLLPDCTSSSDTNCVFFRNKTGSGSVVVQFRVADGKGRI